MGILQELLQDIPVPKMVKVKQEFDDAQVDDLGATLFAELDTEQIKKMVKPGMEIAVAVGSRGLDRLVVTTAVTVKFLQDLCAKPFIVSCMVRLSDASDEGQKAVLV